MTSRALNPLGGDLGQRGLADDVVAEAELEDHGAEGLVGDSGEVFLL